MRTVISPEVQTGSGSQPSIFRMGTCGFSPLVKLLGHEVDTSSPCSDEVKNVSGYISRLPYVCMAWCSTQNGENVACRTRFFS
jgi:hypothetical protein